MPIQYVSLLYHFALAHALIPFLIALVAPELVTTFIHNCNEIGYSMSVTEFWIVSTTYLLMVAYANIKD